MTLAYNAHFIFLPLWFERKRGLAIGVAASGVGAAGIILFPWLQATIDAVGWRQACLLLAAILIVTLVPLNYLLQRRNPAVLDLQPDGDTARSAVAGAASERMRVVDPAWVATDWTLARALLNLRFWCFSLAFLLVLFAWYAIQIHQTKFLQDLGFDRTFAALALGLVPLFAIAGQIVFGLLADRIGREWVWTITCAGFALCFVLCWQLGRASDPWLVWAMVIVQGLIGHGVTPAIGAIPADLFQGRNYGRIYGVIALFGSFGASLGPLCFGYMHDWTGSYDTAFAIAIAACAMSVVLIWIAAPSKVRAAVAARG